MRVERPQKLVFHKWDTKGQTIQVIPTDPAVFDKENSFGSKESYFRGRLVGEEDTEKRIQVPMTLDLREKYKVIEDSIVYGETVLTITWESSKPMKNRAPLKVFVVDAEGLKE
jgi:hypothetical protein